MNYKRFLKLCLAVCSISLSACEDVSFGDVMDSNSDFWRHWEFEDEEEIAMIKSDDKASWGRNSSTYTRGYKPSGSGTVMPNSDMGASIDFDNQKPIVICRQKGCTELNDKMTTSYLFNTIASLFYINNKTKVYMCEANTTTRACESNGLKYAVNIGGTAGVIYIPSLTVTDVSFSKNLKKINFMFSYDLYANGLKSFCTSAYNTIEFTDSKQVLMRDNNYKCQLTSDLPSVSYNIYNIDYVDLDYGIIGAYYSTGMSGASNGGHDGYVLFKFQYTDSSSTRASSGLCKTGICNDNDNYKVAPGQYEVIPLKE